VWGRTLRGLTKRSVKGGKKVRSGANTRDKGDDILVRGVGEIQEKRTAGKKKGGGLAPIQVQRKKRGGLKKKTGKKKLSSPRNEW